MSLTALPRRLPERSGEARVQLADAARHAAPVVLARERMLPVAGPLAALLPGGALRRGSVVALEGRPGAGATSVALALAAAATATGEWAAFVDLEGTLGGRAAAEAGVALERLAVVRPAGAPLTLDGWATVVAALLDGVALAVAEVPRYVRAADARRLVARARERQAVLVPLVRAAPWPAEAALRLRAEGGEWRGLAPGTGLLTDRVPHVRVEEHGQAARAG